MDDELNPSPGEVSFEELLAALQDETQPLPSRLLYGFSGLQSAEVDALRSAWGGLSQPRRLGLVEDLENLAEGNAVLIFDAVNLLALDDEDPRVRLTAVRALWTAERPEFMGRLLDLMHNDPAAEVRAQAAAGLGQYVLWGELDEIPEGDLRQAEAGLLQALQSDGDELVQRRALEALGYSSRPEVPDLIEQAYERDDDDWVASALYAMGRSADDRWTRPVLDRLKDANTELSREAARSAGELEISEALPSLVELLQDEDAELRLAAAWSLSQIGGEGVEEALEELLERSEDDEEIELLEDALENLAFTHEMSEMNILDFSPEALDDLAHPDLPADEDDEPDAD
ncbi:MAG: HEAT repeat domain-containing protein [Anaerolineales bacterium]|nr:HEAT repeat domain-containing protein [Anaerolineales bacterium]